MKILLTGAFGNLGRQVLDQALAQGHEVRCFDIDSRQTRKRARPYAGRCEMRFGDLRDQAFAELVADVDGVIHTAALLPPNTDRFPELARQVNVTACQRLIDAVAACEPMPHFVYASTFSVFAETADRPRPRGVDDPVAATDAYTEYKLEIEDYLAASSIPWTILRVAVAVDASTLSTDRKTLARLLGAAADSPLEYVHPRDVALAMCRCLETPDTRGRTLLIGGGPACRVTQAQFMGTAFRALGLTYPARVHGRDYYYTHWLDTTESQRLLNYQQRDFAVYEREMAQRLRYLRWAFRPLRWLHNPLLGLILGRVHRNA